MFLDQYSGVSPELRALLSILNFSLPFIRGRWFIVDPYGSTSGMENLTPGQVVFNFKDAYNLCRDGAGDGIVVLSGGDGTSSLTTSYLSATLNWTKAGITVIGVASPNAYFGRARIASVERTTGSLTVISFIGASGVYTINRSSGSFITDGFAVGDKIFVDTTSNTNDGSYTIEAVTDTTLKVTESVTTESAVNAGATVIKSFCAPLIKITGQNNTFINLHFSNGGSIVQALGGVSVQANRNSFINCHFIGASNATAAAVASTQFDLELVASECLFDNCIFGTRSTIYAAANGHIKLGSSTTEIGQNFFKNCKVVSYSATAGHGAIFITNAATLGGWIYFDNCMFSNWDSGAITALTTAIIGATPNNCGLMFHNCGQVGWAAWGANNDKWGTTNAIGAAGTGGIMGIIA